MVLNWSCRCLQVNQTPESCQETKFKVINLDNGFMYRFRVTAVNAAGESDPTSLKEPIRVQDRLGEASFLCLRSIPTNAGSRSAVYKCDVTVFRPLEPPELILDAAMTREVKAMAGTHISLMATIKGVPFPTVTWQKNEAEVPTRADIETSQTGTKLEMRFCNRDDCGDYTLTVENPAGSKTATCTVLVFGENQRF